MSSLKSSVIGFATADALGVPIEFTSRNYGKPLTEMVGYGSHSVPEGTWSDDTSMMIATMDSITQCEGIDYNDIMLKFAEWFGEAKYTATDRVFDIGIATRNAIGNFASGKKPTDCGMTGIRENGNGSLMRILPFVFYGYNNKLSEKEMTSLINEASSLTHAHEISKLGCKIYSDYMCNLLDGMNKEQALDQLKTMDYSKYYSKESLDYYKRILDGSIKNASIDTVMSSGFVVHTLEAAIWCTLHHNNYEDAIVQAINLGDDTDTVGAVTGSINGLIYGEENIPKRWTSKLRKKDYLEDLSNNYDKYLDNCKEEKKTK